MMQCVGDRKQFSLIANALPVIALVLDFDEHIDQFVRAQRSDRPFSE
jgi:hypothetical protein